jgi:hypothetical protein
MKYRGARVVLQSSENPFVGRVNPRMDILSHNRRRVVHANVTDRPTEPGRGSRSARPFLGTRRRDICTVIATESTGPHFRDALRAFDINEVVSAPRAP